MAAHGWLLIGGEKMAKSKLNQISPADLADEFGVDPVRYHFLRETPFGLDGDFSAEALVARYNADLANNLGNLLSRVTTVVASKCGGVGPEPQAGSPLAAVAHGAYTAAAEAWDRFAPSEALEATWRLIRETNAHLESHEPWKAEPGPEIDAVLGDAVEALRIVALLVFPAVPAASAEIWRRIGLPGSPADERLPAAASWGGYPGGLTVEKGPPLFPGSSHVVRQPLPPAVRLGGRGVAGAGPRRRRLSVVQRHRNVQECRRHPGRSRPGPA